MSCEGGQHEYPEDTWWEYDARGIELCKVCDACRAEKLAMYRPEVLRNPNYEADEDIEPEPTVSQPTSGFHKLSPGSQRAALSRAKNFYPFD
jgi:hypothetical protein